MDRSNTLRRSTLLKAGPLKTGLLKAGLLAAGLLTVAALVFSAPAQAGEKKAKAHLEFRPTYEQALLEARIRNLPLFVSRHKDF